MARTKAPPSPPIPIRMEVGGKTHLGSYSVDQKMITTFYLGRNKTAKLGDDVAAPETLARNLLAEMVRESRAKP
jgi:hypothetical protein